MWGCSAEELRRRLAEGFVRAGKPTPNKPQKYIISYVTGGVIDDIKSGKAIVTGHNSDGSVIARFPKGRDKMPTTNWNRPTHDAQRYGTNILNQIISNRFSFPKSLYAVRDALIVDFFAGSGTTLHAVNLLNAEEKALRAVQVTRPPMTLGNGSVSPAKSRGRARFAVSKDTTSTTRRSREIISVPICLWLTASKPTPLFSSLAFLIKISSRSAGSSKNFYRCCGLRRGVTASVRPLTKKICRQS